jgi:hypothetical protein
MDNTKTVILLNNQSILYIITKINIFNQPKKNPISIFILDNRYSGITFQGIILDNKTARIFIAGLLQVIALSKLDLIILVNYFTARNYWIKFSIRKTLSLRTIQVNT